MTIWTAEIKELETLYTSIKGRFPELEKELARLIKADDENMVLLYSRRCLEVIITELCESELKRPRKTEPLKGIIDKLHHEEKIPSHIITSMQNLNSLSTSVWYFGDFKKQFYWKDTIPLQVMRRETNNEDSFKRDIVAQVKVRFRGKLFAVDNKYCIRNTAS